MGTPKDDNFNSESAEPVRNSYLETLQWIILGNTLLGEEQPSIYVYI